MTSPTSGDRITADHLHDLADRIAAGLPQPYQLDFDDPDRELTWYVHDLDTLRAVLGHMPEGFIVTHDEGFFPVVVTGSIAGLAAHIGIERRIALAYPAEGMDRPPLTPALAAVLHQAVYA